MSGYRNLGGYIGIGSSEIIDSGAFGEADFMPTMSLTCSKWGRELQ